VWSAGPDLGYVRRLRKGGFTASERSVPAHVRARIRHTVFMAVKPS
jgi:hypothetical protein